MTAVSLSNFVIDISHHEPDVDFVALKAAGIVGVIHKATEGLRTVDPFYSRRKQKAEAVGLLWGAYHFGLREDAQAQADHFLSVAQPDEHMLVALDFETPHTVTEGPTMLIEQAVEFVEAIHAKLGRYPYLYSGDVAKTDLGNTINDTLAKCRLWLAEYGETPHIQASWHEYTLWQYTNGAIGPQPHTVGGVGHCDRNKFMGDENALRQVWAS